MNQLILTFCWVSVNSSLINVCSLFIFGSCRLNWLVVYGSILQFCWFKWWTCWVLLKIKFQSEQVEEKMRKVSQFWRFNLKFFSEIFIWCYETFMLDMSMGNQCCSEAHQKWFIDTVKIEKKSNMFITKSKIAKIFDANVMRIKH